MLPDPVVFRDLAYVFGAAVLGGVSPGSSGSR